MKVSSGGTALPQELQTSTPPRLPINNPSDRRDFCSVGCFRPEQNNNNNDDNHGGTALSDTTRGSFLTRRQGGHPGVVLSLVIYNSANH